MDRTLLPDADAEALRPVVADFLTDLNPSGSVQGILDVDPAVRAEQWRTAATQLGLAGLLAPEADGGSAAGWSVMSAVLEEAGAALWPAPLLSTAVLAVTALDAVGSPAAHEHLRRVAAGDTVAAVIIDHGSSSRVDDGADGVRLSASPMSVVDGMGADLILLLRPTAEGRDQVLAIDADAPGLRREPTSTLDLTQPAARVTLDAVPAEHLGTAEGLAARLRRRHRAGLAAVQLGGLRRCLELSVAHAQQRVQFGQPIGGFQAIRHRCAQMLIERERAAALLAAAVGALAACAPDVDADVAAAAVGCGDAYAWVAAETIQVHGGTGFTWEHPAHLHYRRAIATRATAGPRSDHHQTIARARLATLT